MAELFADVTLDNPVKNEVYDSQYKEQSDATVYEHPPFPGDCE
jgi:hypothetical protein